MKKYLFVVTLLTAMAFMPSCAKEAERYEFPIDRETVESVVQDKNLTWKITDEQNRESQSSFVMKESGDEHGRADIGITAIFNSIGNEEERYMSVQIMYPNDYSVKQIQEEQVKNLPLLFDIAAEIYGNVDSAKAIYDEFVKYLDGYGDYESNGVQWENEMNDAHVLLRMSPLNKGIMYRKCAVFIMNDVSYEKYMDGMDMNQ